MLKRTNNFQVPNIMLIAELSKERETLEGLQRRFLYRKNIKKENDFSLVKDIVQVRNQMTRMVENEFDRVDPEIFQNHYNTEKIEKLLEYPEEIKPYVEIK
ncbi:hypothetical protein [Halanaerobium sp.]|uniref:hypothetical protein n=1 Tax=Halanaerobium sp. TaxID=1895664 RepID=UPI000DE61650|nr:hypothetical protein [Halanaerobium sp.]PUU87241.1 MAG: hypothetical protein CI949_3676 [Halanaerobium sp.]